MASLRSLTLAALASLALAACESEASRVTDREDLLAAAGFTVRPANTPEREQSLATLPPHRFVRQDHGDKVVYVYADPLVCNCLYIGDQAAYGRYRQEMFQRKLADEQRLTAQMNQENWEWGAWGPGW